MLAAGILALLGARRRARLRSAEAPARLPLPRPQSVALERRLRAIGSSERLLRVDVALRAAAPAVAAHDQRVLLVRVGADGTIELVLSGPAELPAPWERAGTWWSLPPHVAVDDLAAAARTVGAPCVAVTTLGTDAGGCEVLVDVEALGVLSIDAGDRADDVARAIAVGLASSELAEVAHLVGVGLDADGGSSCLLGHRNASVVDTLDEAIELGTELIGARSETRSRNTFALRARHSGGEAWEPAVVIVASAHAAEVAGPVLADVTARPGLALVVAGPVPGAPWTLVAQATAWTLQPLGLSLTPVGVSVEQAGELAELIEPTSRWSRWSSVSRWSSPPRRRPSTTPSPRSPATTSSRRSARSSSSLRSSSTRPAQQSRRRPATGQRQRQRARRRHRQRAPDGRRQRPPDRRRRW